MNDKAVSYGAGHRERLRKKFLAGKLADYELVELLLAYAIPRCDVKPIARSLMNKFGGIHHIVSAPIDALTATVGIKENTAVLIKLIYEIMIMSHRGGMADTPIFHDYQRLSDYCKTLLTGKTVEEFHVIYLGADYKLLRDDTHSAGTIDWAAVYPREILKRALELNARSVVLMHNHPVSNTSFSTQDIEITNTIKKLMASVEIDLFDHLLLSANGIVHSAKNMFLIK